MTHTTTSRLPRPGQAFRGRPFVFSAVVQTGAAARRRFLQVALDEPDQVPRR